MKYIRVSLKEEWLMGRGNWIAVIIKYTFNSKDNGKTQVRNMESLNQNLRVKFRPLS